MKIKAASLGMLMVVFSVVFAACGKAEDGKITTENNGTSAPTSAYSEKNETKNEMSSIVGDISKGASEAASELRKSITRMYS